MNFIRLPVLLLLMLLLASCAKHIELSSEADADYSKAKHLLDTGAYTDATLFLEQYEAKYPYSRHAIQAQILHIFAAYKDKEYVLSETLSQRFIDQHPRHPNVDYAKYLLAMSHFKEMSDPGRDPTQTLAAVDSFKALIREHPNSKYTQDAEGRLQYLYNRLAEHELAIGKFYFDNGRFVASANRFQGIVAKYQTTTSVAEALYYLAASYAKLELKRDAHDMAVLLRHNFPKSDWSDDVKEFL